MFNIFKVSVPMPTLLPMDTDDGTLATYISVVNPAVGAADIVEIVVEENVVTPILKELFNFDMSVDNPDILIKSLFLKSWLDSVKIDISFSDHVITDPVFTPTWVSIEDIDFPSTDDTMDIKPSPPVPSLSKF